MSTGVSGVDRTSQGLHHTTTTTSTMTTTTTTIKKKEEKILHRQLCPLCESSLPLQRSEPLMVRPN